ncbi:dynein intermediate chain 1, axonemal [Oryzias latipes]|uniref:dynein intermediate chain 1, axonemal n=1 Tax=Oryzias latipes TaxID=8090 RepID=UPI0009D9A1EE|nr:dynein intermediate chain 1, axonemal [Oryzias latipes]XP_023810789.1 dynein intermediate chain 1, axonemal [Oryzias latipes]XP_023810790.1 dynein intermediate chain 1, axonemal [Oryzias latipes]XP_023810791.1 dynein intermediate chain 1, axonemal [Oryzias latipes]XP_023810792.1 dynein intermediate chain 1, axonemal [Oryzias latipes]XP_023810793.1 dynein intermediate chain 1, axonemal [Oryzias latipes]XP_023810794.1 dynein intermediate chain 1, axonemal [Oryzias latipes]XP_023810795.1 dyn
MENNTLHQDPDDAQSLMANEDIKEETTVQAGGESEEDRAEASVSPVKDRTDAEKNLEENRSHSTLSEADTKEQFVFNEKGTQILINPTRSINTQTDATLHCSFSSNVNQWVIYDAYKKELKKRQEQEGGHLLKENSDTGRKKTLLMETKIDELSKIRESCKLMERAVVQNSLCDIAIDFKFYEDPSDEFIGHEGTLMPLWNFRYKGTKHLTVSALCWNRRYLDMFAVGMGTEDYFDQQCGGMVLIYSLKNPTYPEYAYKTASGVRCVDIHPHKSYLVAAGFYDGNVAVYNLKVEKLKPVCASSPETGKHMDPVIQLCWQKDDINNNHNFYSVSLDGQIVSWTLVKNELVFAVKTKLSLQNPFTEGTGNEILKEVFSKVSCTSIDFHKDIPNLFLVGTLEGMILKCSMTYTGHPMEVYDAHLLSVGTVKWNPFHPKVFISCSCDMTVKIWDHTVTTPISNIDLKEPVEDVAFSPHTSTVFAAVTRRGTVYFYDVSISIYEAICQQEVVNKRKGQLTKLEFNPIHLIIIIGDGKGCIHSFKLSPNLRKRPKNKKGQEIPIDPQEEVGKLEKFLISRLNARQSAP